MRTNQKKGTVLLLAYRFPPENASGAARPFRFFKYLPEFGYSCRVIARGKCRPDGGDERVRWAPAETGVRTTAWASSLCHAFERWCLPYSERLRWLPHAVRAAADLMQEEPYQAVVSTSPPVVSHIAALRLKRRFGLKWIADFRDPVVGNPFRNRSGALGYDTRLEKWLFRNADIVIANTDTVAAMWHERYPQWRKKVRLIWNGFDPEDEFGPAALVAKPFRSLTHVGTLYGGRTPDQLLVALRHLINQGLLDPGALRVNLVGPLEPAMIAPFRDLVESGCLWASGGMVPKTEAMQAVAESDYLLLIDSNELARALQVPAKLFDYIRAGRPILAFTSRNSPVERILARSAVDHICVHPTDPGEIVARQVLTFLKLPVEPAAPSSWFQSTFDGREQVRSLAAILGNLLECGDIAEPCEAAAGGHLT